jgi:hypothetical protein
MSILLCIATGKFDLVIGQAEILLTAFFMKCAQPYARELLVTVAVPVNAAVFGKIRRKVGNCVKRGIGIFSKYLHVLVAYGRQMAGERFPFIRNSFLLFCFDYIFQYLLFQWPNDNRRSHYFFARRSSRSAPGHFAPGRHAQGAMFHISTGTGASCAVGYYWILDILKHIYCSSFITV